MIVFLMFWYILQSKVGASLKERGELVSPHTKDRAPIFIEANDTGF